MIFTKKYTDLREVKMTEANELIAQGFELLYISQDRWWEKSPEGANFGIRAKIRYVVGRPAGRKSATKAD